MAKHFDQWNIVKKDIHKKGEAKFYNAREVWWCALGVNVGSEQDGDEKTFERPVLIVKGISRDTCMVVPLTTSKSKHKLRIDVGQIDGKSAKALISQLRIVDTRRLSNKVLRLNRENFQVIQKSIKDFL